MSIVLDGEQHFTCQHCGRCCRHAWDIPILPSEAATYRAAGASRWYREREDGPEGAERDPFEAVRHDGSLLRLRKRPDGSCGFLSPGGLCRIHEELGERRKPLACRAFPFRFYRSQGETLAAASFSCPTVARNQGADLASQRKQIERLARDWQQAFPDVPRQARFLAEKPLDQEAVAVLRRTLCAVVDRPDGDLRTNLGRLADLMEDLCRPGVVRLDPEAFLDYLSVVGRFAAESDKPRRSRRPTWLSRVFFRGYLFAAAAIRLRIEARCAQLPRLRLWWRQLRLLMHAHALAPALTGFDLGKAHRMRIPSADSAVWRVAHAYCRGGLASLGTGRWPIVTEIGVVMASLRVAFVFAAQHAPGREMTEDSLVRGLTEAADLHHADAGMVGRFVGLLAGGLEPLQALASEDSVV